jgi:hypothetical protein
LLAEHGIPKAVFNDFAVLHQLGDARLEVNSDSTLVTRRKDGSLAIAAWNLLLPEETGSPKTFTLHRRPTRLTLAGLGCDGPPGAPVVTAN